MKLRTLLFIAFLGGVIYILAQKPLNERQWSPEQERLPEILMYDDHVSIQNIRNFSYDGKAISSYDWMEEEYLFERLEDVSLVYTNFKSYDGRSHMFLTFRFTDDKTLVASFDARREDGETFAMIWSPFRQYELYPVLATERDMIGQRLLGEEIEVYIVPISLNKSQLRSAFKTVLEDVNSLRKKPQFYHPFFNNFSNQIVGWIREIRNKKIPYSMTFYLKDKSGNVFYELGLVSTDFGDQDIRNKYLARPKNTSWESYDFSEDIRRRESN